MTRSSLHEKWFTLGLECCDVSEDFFKKEIPSDDMMGRIFKIESELINLKKETIKFLAKEIDNE